MSTEEGQKCAQDNGLLFIETSAKTADHVENAFLDTATQIYNKVEKGEIDISSEVLSFYCEGLWSKTRKCDYFTTQEQRRSRAEQGWSREIRKEGRRVLLIYLHVFKRVIRTLLELFLTIKPCPVLSISFDSFILIGSLCFYYDSGFISIISSQMSFSWSQRLSNRMNWMRFCIWSLERPK